MVFIPYDVLNMTVEPHPGFLVQGKIKSLLLKHVGLNFTDKTNEKK